jgi:acetyl-CoA C-acetyltransferase
MSLDPRTPVLVGVAAVDAASAGLADPVMPEALMIAAARAAAADAGAPDLLRRVGWVAVPEGSEPVDDPGRTVADALGAPARTALVHVGVTQHAPVHLALERIRSGQLDAALVVGGESRASRSRVRKAGGEFPVPPAGTPDEPLRTGAELMAQPEIDAGMWAAVEHYACIEAALTHAEGRTPAETASQVDALWQRFEDVARANPLAAFVGNRNGDLLAHPYAKWHSTQWNVDQAGALLLCSAEAARAAGVPEDRWVFPRASLSCSLGLSLSRRADLHRWPTMGVLGQTAAGHLGRPPAEWDAIDLYSCFPAAVRVQQRELGLDPAGTPTVTGGMAFAGGPFNNYTYMSTAAVAAGLRASDGPDPLGAVTTVSGLLTRGALAVWSTRPGDLLLDDVGAAAEDATATCPVTGDHHGPATVATATATPFRTYVLADLADGTRWVGTTEDPALNALVTGTEQGPVGVQVALDGATCRLA